MREIDKIILHCSATTEGEHFTVADIDSWHKERGFKSIGYHFVIYLDGSVHKGRPVSEMGAHTLGENKHSIGICYIGGLAQGNIDADTRTQAQKVALHNLVNELREQFPSATVHGHYEFSSKACPCFDVEKEFSQKAVMM